MTLDWLPGSTRFLSHLILSNEQHFKETFLASSLWNQWETFWPSFCGRIQKFSISIFFHFRSEIQEFLWKNVKSPSSISNWPSKKCPKTQKSGTWSNQRRNYEEFGDKPCICYQEFLAKILPNKYGHWKFYFSSPFALKQIQINFSWSRLFRKSIKCMV